MRKKINIGNLLAFAIEINLFALIIVMILTFLIQFTLEELPCTLCILQRAGLLMAGSGFLLNLRFGLRPSHYSITLLGLLFTAFVALRQIALHVEPGTGAYGSSFFGWHLYTWSFIIAVVFIVFTSILLGFNSQYREPLQRSLIVKIIVPVLLISMLILTISNCLNVLNICGLKACPEHPVWRAGVIKDQG